MIVGTGARGDVPGVYAVIGGTVHPVSGPAISGGVVVIRDGLIEAVGAGIPIPPDATVIEVAGSHVYPGLFDAHTSLGFAARTSTRPADAKPQEETTAASVAARDVVLTDAD